MAFIPTLASHPGSKFIKSTSYGVDGAWLKISEEYFGMYLIFSVFIAPASNPNIFSLNEEFSRISSAFFDSNSDILLPPISAKKYLTFEAKDKTGANISLAHERKFSDENLKAASNIIPTIMRAKALLENLLCWRKLVFMFNQSFPETIQVFEYSPAPPDDSGKRIFGSYNRDLGLGFQNFIKPAQKRSASDQIYAAMHDVRHKLRRGFLNYLPGRFRNSAYGFCHRLPDVSIRNYDFARKTRYQISSPNT